MDGRTDRTHTCVFLLSVSGEEHYLPGSTVSQSEYWDRGWTTGVRFPEVGWISFFSPPRPNRL